jgi:glyoxylase-like metal-dependent hydrolase (beta-lactamase superfamily II)
VHRAMGPLAAVLCLMGALSDPQERSVKRPGYVLREIRDGLYWLSDGVYNTMFIVSSKGVVAVDPLPTLGARYLEAIASVTQKPVTHLVYSHEHTDHIGAASLLPAAIAIVAHRETARLLASRRDPRRPPPTVAFDDRYVLELGDQSLVLEYRGPSHSPGNVFIYAPRQKVLMLVDVVYPGYAPYPGLGVAADVPGYVQAHRDALTYDFTAFVGGHVDRLGRRSDVEQSLEFVVDLERTSRHVLAEKPFPSYLVQRGAVDSFWFAHDDYEGDRIERCYEGLAPRWKARLLGVERMLRSHCRSMIVALAIQTPEASNVPPGEAKE